ncbi:hypothetical protein [Thauera butanivorans]|uniref:hypothetical protein n=1 Tax=Thauera butanivorans TaxID=86174 RepID=UPI000838DA7B|nr:hypothetical protein [Thauera butanivorans]
MTRTEIITRLRTLSTEMIEVGAAMDYYAGLSDGPMSKHAAELVDAGLIVAEWAKEIEKESP